MTGTFYGAKSILSNNDKNFLFNDRLKESNPKVESLWQLGTLNNSDLNSISVIGSRKMTQYGKDATKLFVTKLVKNGFTVISGLMYGIDLEAHKNALEAGGRTIAVLGYGFDFLEKNNYAIPVVKNILLNDRGAIFSEFDHSHPADKWTFPKRNRIVAAMSRAVLIVEADENSGSLITADMALEQGKDVFVIPGSIFSDLSRGKHKLIKEGAILVHHPDDILEYYNISAPVISSNLLLSTDKQKILNLLKSEPLSLEAINMQTKISVNKIMSDLTELEVDGMIKRATGNKFHLVVV